MTVEQECAVKEIIDLATKIRTAKDLGSDNIPALVEQVYGLVAKKRMMVETAMKKFDIDYVSSLRDEGNTTPRPYMAAFLICDFYRIREILLQAIGVHQIKEATGAVAG